MKREGKPVKEVLHLVLSYKWYDMIESGEKPEEYRSISVWKNRICRDKRVDIPTASIQVPTDIKLLCLHRGYTNHTMMWSVKGIRVGKGNPKWGAPEENVFIIKLNQKLLP